MAVRAGKVGVISDTNGLGEGNLNQTLSAGDVGKPTIPEQSKASKDGNEYGFSNDSQRPRHRRRPSSGEDGSFSNSQSGISERALRERLTPSLGVSPRHPHAYIGRKTGSASPMIDKSGPGTPTRNRPEKYGVTVPKFGDWDVNDPASADGFTVIFDKALDEKKAGGALRVTDSPLKGETDVQKTHSGNRESSSWFCSCFHPSTV